MKKILLLLVAAGIIFASCAYWQYSPAINYQKDMTAPYKIAIHFHNGTSDTMEVSGFRSCNIWAGNGNFYYQIKKINSTQWAPISNISYIEILQACKKPQKVQIQRTYNNNPHNYNYNYWD